MEISEKCACKSANKLAKFVTKEMENISSEEIDQITSRYIHTEEFQNAASKINEQYADLFKSLASI